MLKHIVLFKMLENAEGASGKENALKLAEMFQNFVGKIPQLKKMETGLNINNEKVKYDLGLYSEFESMDTLAEYTANPEHLKVINFVFKVIDNRVVVDFEF